METTKVAVLGLGIIGSAWALNLIEDGLNVRPWNRTPQPDFPHFEADALRAVDGADLIIIVVADPQAVESILDTIEPKLGSGQIVVQSSTISVAWSKQFAERIEKTGARFLEAPFTGSKLAAQARQTVFYLAGEASTLDDARPVLGRLSKTILHIGPLGTASTLKLAMNLNIAAIAGALNEGLSLCRQNGITDEAFFDALHQNVARSGVSDLKEPKLLARDYSAQFSVKHMEKDLRLALETAQESGLELPETQAVRSVYQQGLAHGWGDDDFSALIQLLEHLPAS
ncbi:2-hydroxy-3-oxopropionate reductase [Abditibacteriota bacterium]|nr:2-hydroxy-3-oxopropionate reductase [Abditibacteriota bacterium]